MGWSRVDSSLIFYMTWNIICWSKGLWTPFLLVHIFFKVELCLCLLIGSYKKAFPHVFLLKKEACWLVQGQKKQTYSQSDL